MTIECGFVKTGEMSGSKVSHSKGNSARSGGTARVRLGSTAAGRVWATWVHYRRISPVAAHSGEGLFTERRTAAQPWRRELVFMPHRRRRASPRRERIAAIWLSARPTPLDDAESLSTDKRHVVGHYRLGESLQGERAHLFGYDTSF